MWYRKGPERNEVYKGVVVEVQEDHSFGGDWDWGYLWESADDQSKTWLRGTQYVKYKWDTLRSKGQEHVDSELQRWTNFTGWFWLCLSQASICAYHQPNISINQYAFPIVNMAVLVT